MKLLLSRALQVLFVATTVLVVSSEEDHHGDDLEAFVCADLNVTGTSSCEEWCGPSLRPEWTYTTGHGHFEEFQLAYLTGWMCHCYPLEEEDAEAAAEEKHCMDAVQLTTCSSKGLADCGADATMTCAELCVALGLGLGVDANVTDDGITNSTSDRFLSEEVFMSVITDDHFCAHHEAEEERRHRFLHEGSDHDVTLCYCNSLAENDAGSTVVCADASLAEEHSEETTADSATRYKASVMRLGVVMAGSMLLGTSILVAGMY